MISNEKNIYLKPSCEILKVEMNNLMAGSTTGEAPPNPGDGGGDTPFP